MSLINRREVKIYIPENSKKYFFHWFLLKFGIVKSHKKRVINSLYFDTANYKSALDNIIGLSKRRKYRFRWYGTSKDTFGNFEIKTKNNILSQKETYQLDIKVKDLNFNRMLDLSSYEFNKLNNHIKKKLLNIKLFPNLLVKYERKYYKFYNLDLTLDDKLNFSQFDSIQNRKVEDFLVFEIKYNIKFEHDVKLLLNDCHLAISRNSKYLQGLHLLNKFNYV
jgi:hypothetical protein